MNRREFGLTLALFPSPPSSIPASPPSMAIGSPTPQPSSRPELALYFNSPTALPHQKKPIPLVSSNNVNSTRKRERSPLVATSDESEKGNKRNTKEPRKMRSSPFLSSAGQFFHSLSSSSSSSAAAEVAVPAADGITGARRYGDTVTSPGVNSAEKEESMETFKVVSRSVRQRVAAQSSSAASAASAIAVDTTAPARSVEVECTSPTSPPANTTSSSSAVPPTPSSASSKSPFKKRRRVVKTSRPSSPLRNPPLVPSDFLNRPPSPAAVAPSKPPKVAKRKPAVWEKRPLIQKVILKEFERTPHGAEILRRGAKSGIAFLEKQKGLVSAAEESRDGRKSDDDATVGSNLIVV
ncbi:hypothetical protein FRB90_009406, partial [Tulasnella sp. 427]